jgi:G3E family GTPase
MASAMGVDKRIPVTVVTGFLGSGKTTLLNRVLVAPEAARMAVVVNEIGEVGIDHRLIRRVHSNVILLESGCVCCSVRGDLVDTLRDLFMASLHREIAPLSRVLIETTGMADPAPIMYTLQYERFLCERYVYDGCITVFDGVHGVQQLARHPEALQQAALADAIVFSKADLSDAAGRTVLDAAVSRINADAPRYDMQALPGLADLMAASSAHRNMLAGASRSARGLWTAAGPVASLHSDVHVLTLSGFVPLARGAFLRAMSVLLPLGGADLLRMKGLVRFRGEKAFSVVHGVHQQLYPVEPWMGDSDSGVGLTDGDSALVFILRGGDPVAFERKARDLLCV